MKRKNAMSAMGYAICAVIVLGIVMIISAPMFVKDTKDTVNDTPQPEQREESYINIAEEIRRVEESLSSRIDQLESAASSDRNEEKITNKYICTMDKSPEGQLEPLDGEPRKFVFVCEYNK